MEVYLKTVHVINKKNGDWFEGGLDKGPNFATGPKSHIWKCPCHTGRALIWISWTCLSLFFPASEAKKKEIAELAQAWNAVASLQRITLPH